MARTLSEIYQQAKEYRDRYLELTGKEVSNDSKMSVIDAFTWAVSACIWSFDNLLEVFQSDVALDLQNRINGTPSYYANALLKYQEGDSLEMNDEGTMFYYRNLDESKRIITKVSYNEFQDPGFYDKKVIFKVAKGEVGQYERLTPAELMGVQSYLKSIAFAGSAIEVVSRKGDVLVPTMTVYHDGSLTEDELYDKIEEALENFVTNIDFNGKVYVQKIVDSIQAIEQVVDIPISDINISVAQYDDDDNLIPTEDGSNLHTVGRVFVPSGGFIKQSSGKDQEADIPDWKSVITLKVESDEVSD